MKLNDLIKKMQDDRLDFSVDLNDKDGDGVIEQLDKIFIYALASGTLENGFRLPRLSDCEKLGVSRGSLFLFYNELPKRFAIYLGQIPPNESRTEVLDAIKKDETNPAAQLNKYFVNLKYSEGFFTLTEKVFAEGQDLKKLRTGKGSPEPTGIYAEIQDIISQCSAIRYPKQKIIDYFNEEMQKQFFNAANRALLARITCAFQWNTKDIRSLAEVVNHPSSGKKNAKSDSKKGKKQILITDVYVPYSKELSDSEWEIECFTEENGLSYTNMNFANGEKEYKKYDTIYCPDHSFAENLLSANEIYNFLLTAKNKLKENGRLIINLFDPDAQFVEQSKEKNQKKRFDLILKEDGEAVDRNTNEVVAAPSDDTRAIFRDVKELLSKKLSNWNGKEIAFTKMSSFLHCDMECETLKRNLGIDPEQTTNADGTPIKVWSFAEELKYVFTIPENVDLDGVPQDCKFSGYLDYRIDQLSKSVVKKDMLEYVLIDPTNFIRILHECGFSVEMLDSNLNPYDLKNPNPNKNIYYVCTVK